MSNGLPVSRLIKVNVILNPPNAEFENLNLPMIFGDSNVIDVNQRYRSYTDADEVLGDFGSDAPEYLAALDFFNQVPTPQNLLIARWAQSATHGLLECGFLSQEQQQIANWNTIANAEFHINVDGGGLVNIGPLDFTVGPPENLNAIAAIINTAVGAHGAACIWNGNQFVFTSASTGAASTVAYLTAGGGGTNIATQLAGTAATEAIIVNGIVAESALAAVELLDDQPVDFYGITFASPDYQNSDTEAIAAWVEDVSLNPHMLGYTTQDPNALNAESETDIGYILQHANGGLGYNRTFGQYSSTDPYAVASIFGRMATVDFTQPNSTISLMYKQEPGVPPEQLTTTQANTLDAKNYNYFASYNSGVAILESGVCSSGVFIDETWGADWFANDIQINLFNFMLQAPKVPQTDDGAHSLVTNVLGSCAQSNSNGLVGPGVWEQEGFGQLSTGEFLETGYYAFAPSVSTQNQQDRRARRSPLIQVAAIFAGAINTVNVQVNVMR